MIEINLLPQERRRQKKSYLKFDLQLFEIGKFRFLAGGVLIGILVLLLIVPSLGTSVRKKQIKRLLAKEEFLKPQKTQVDEVNNQKAVLRGKLVALDGLTKRRFVWARKLNELSDLVLPGIWFTRIYRDREGSLVIEGSVLSKREEAMASVGKFMKDIRDDGAFFKDFSNMKLESVQRRSIKDRDVVDFKIALYF